MLADIVEVDVGDGQGEVLSVSVGGILRQFLGDAQLAKS